MIKVTFDFKDQPIDYVAYSKVFATKTGYKFPDQYLQFLIENGTGESPKPGFYNECFEIGCFFSFSSDTDDLSNIEFNNERLINEQFRLSKNILAFAETPDSHLVLGLILNGPLSGVVVMVGDDSILLADDYKASDLDEDSIIEYSFNDFISKLGDINDD